MRDAEAWAEEEFGHAELGDRRRTRRLVRLTAEVAGKPAGMVTRACRSTASREGAFRLLESSDVHAESVREAVETATLRRCQPERRVFVPIDATSLTLSDESNSKELGGIGAWRKGARGVHVMTALAVTSGGTALGICGQHMWIREARSQHDERRGALGKDSETSIWVDLLLDARRRFSESAPSCQPWFQMDRGADCWKVLTLAQDQGLLMTVRAAYDRRVDDDDVRLWSTVERADVIAKRKIAVPARPARHRKRRLGEGKRVTYLAQPRAARRATVSIRAACVDVRPRAGLGGATTRLNAVLVRENRRGEDRVEWMLLTTHPIATRQQVLEIVRGYTLRWRIEDFHRVWKRGLCRVEETQLRSRNAIFKWATILAAVATRAMRLTQLARSTPDAPASTEFSPTELEAIVALRQPKETHDLASLTLSVAVRWVADLGGYTGPWNGPPGPTVIGRGLYDVLVAARAFESRDKKR
jgi:hypothetical protein